MRLYHFLAIIFLVAISIPVLKAQAEGGVEHLKCHETYSSEQLKEDFLILITSLKELHPDLYRVSSKEKIEHRLSLIEQSISNDQSYLTFLKLVAPLLTDIGCINTQWGHASEYIKYRNENIPLFPIKFKVVKDLFIVEESWSTNKQIKKGDTIISFNGISTKNYLEKNYPLLPIDGNIKSIQHEWLSMAFPKHHTNFWEQPSHFNILVQSNDKAKQISIEALLNKDIQKINKDHSNHKKSSIELFFKDSIAIMRSNVFESRLIDSLDSIFKVIHDRKTKTLILDIRGMSFRPGSHQYAMELYSYLIKKPNAYAKIRNKQTNPLEFPHNKHISHLQTLNKEDSIMFCSKVYPKANSFKNQLYVISNGWNIGASGFFAAKIKNRDQTSFVGEKPGATTFGMNFKVSKLVLPNTRIEIYIPKYQLIANEKAYLDKSGISIMKQIKGEDNHLETVIEYVKNSDQ